MIVIFYLINLLLWKNSVKLSKTIIRIKVIRVIFLILRKRI